MKKQVCFKMKDDDCLKVVVRSMYVLSLDPLKFFRVSFNRGKYSPTYLISTVQVHKLVDRELQEPLFDVFLWGVLFKYKTKF